MMVSTTIFCQLALSFPQVEEQPHFDRRSFRVKNKIFATLSEKEKRVMVKLDTGDQWVFCSFNKDSIYPVPGYWGKQGCTFIDLKKIKKAILKDALTVAWCTIASKAMLTDFYKK
jgi:predicted DNA-binding protein (MmcQ/YjbR family)